MIRTRVRKGRGVGMRTRISVAAVLHEKVIETSLLMMLGKMLEGIRKSLRRRAMAVSRKRN
jgi:hypothetical protein